ncbi:HDOD domain-containing protein [Allochromatium palmeri]|uniref:HDOD domain-containing protein n=1 Tax=Allochromatium palmeri TaxID=231048 RepID=A0A6N8EF24_9GAMM|nr:HDOD domain-containing protein [Allochromatium palmeri]MTW21137.1 HDOD domain-containing protein [Allochromatium palmeri]
MTPESLVGETQDLFSLPDVVRRINQLIDAPDTRSADLAEVIRFDPGLSARLLRVVNSALYARPQPIETVTQAINLIGHQALRDLVMATCMVDLFKGLPPDWIDMDRFWFQAVACGIGAGDIASRAGLSQSERLFMTGLLHSLGRLIFVTQCPNDYLDVLRLIEQESLESSVAEQRVFGFDYTRLSAELLKAWGFPESIWMAIAQVSMPAQATQYRVESEILHVAILIADRLMLNHVGGTVPTVDRLAEESQALAEYLSLDPEALDELPDAIALQVMDVFGILMPEASLIF